MKPDKACIDLIQQFEGLRLKPYLDSAGIPTIGYGSTIYDNNVIVTMEDATITTEQALKLLKIHLNELALQISKMITTQLSQAQFDAIMSLSYNIGIGNFRKSTLLKLINKGDFFNAADHFLEWSHINHVTNKGLLSRRVAEQKLFLIG